MKALLLNQKLFDEALTQHKRLVARIGVLFRGDRTHVRQMKEEKSHYLSDCKLQSKELSLAISQGKCECCGATERLSWHHLVSRRAKMFMPFNRYFTSRHYWSNITVLCWKCHKAYHEVIDYGKTEHETEISKELLTHIMNRYYVNYEL